METRLAKIPEGSPESKNPEKPLTFYHYKGKCPACKKNTRFGFAGFKKNILKAATFPFRKPTKMLKFFVAPTAYIYECEACGHKMAECENCNIFFSINVWADFVTCPSCKTEYHSA